ncbi:MAG TPA: hypothetical protein VIZ43_29395 [Trebonia sp.]
MSAGMVPWTGAVPRRARHLIPKGLPRRGEVIAGFAVGIVVAHLLLAQLTLVVALVCAVVSRISRWRPWWLLAPATAGLAWTLAIGPDQAAAGFAAGPAGILWHLGGGHLTGEIAHPLAGFGGAGSWLTRQFPVALIAGAAEAALVGWLDWLHTDEWAVPPPRPGLVAAARRALAASMIRGGAVVTRDGCALGVVSATGAVAELRWAELSHGALITGADGQQLTLAGLQVVHAALRLRKPVIILDPGDAAITRAVAAACRATGTPLRAAGGNGPAGHGTGVAATAGAAAATGTVAASRLWGRSAASEVRSTDPPAMDLGRVVRERSAAALLADSAERAAAACADLVALAADLRRIGVDGDALLWLPRGEHAPAPALAALLRDGPEAGLSVLIAATSPAAAAELDGLVGTSLIYRVADRALAASLAARTGTRLLPVPMAAAAAGPGPGAGPWPPASGAPPSGAPPSGGDAAHPAGDAVHPGGLVPGGASVPVGFPAPSGFPPRAVPSTVAPDLAPGPVIPAQALLTLDRAEFVLAVGRPWQRLVALGRTVPGRLPRRPVSAGEPDATPAGRAGIRGAR